MVQFHSTTKDPLFYPLQHTYSNPRGSKMGLSLTVNRPRLSPDGSPTAMAKLLLSTCILPTAPDPVYKWSACPLLPKKH